MKIKISGQDHFRPGGGLSLGIRYFFPGSVYDEETNLHYKVSELIFGIIFYSIKIQFSWGYKKYEKNS